MINTIPPAPELVHRSAVKGDAPSEAIYSPCLKYRYSLRRVWDVTKPRFTFVMLNPSTATEAQNDPTVERCERRSRTLGGGAMCVVNIFAWRDTDPKGLRLTNDPVGPENDRMILSACEWANMIVAAWGTHGAYLDRGDHVRSLLSTQTKPAYHLGLTKDGHPKHPLYISYSQQPIVWAVSSF